MAEGLSRREKGSFWHGGDAARAFYRTYEALYKQRMATQWMVTPQ
jgi:hypothetical protein